MLASDAGGCKASKVAKLCEGNLRRQISLRTSTSLSALLILKRADNSQIDAGICGSRILYRYVSEDLSEPLHYNDL